MRNWSTLQDAPLLLQDVTGLQNPLTLPLVPFTAGFKLSLPPPPARHSKTLRGSVEISTVGSTSLFFIGTENVTNWTNLTILHDYETIIITDTATTCYKMLGGSLDKDWTGLDIL